MRIRKSHRTHRTDGHLRVTSIQTKWRNNLTMVTQQTVKDQYYSTVF